MKKVLTFLLFGVSSTLPIGCEKTNEGNPILTVTSPSPAKVEIWKQGEKHRITWRITGKKEAWDKISITVAYGPYKTVPIVLGIPRQNGYIWIPCVPSVITAEERKKACITVRAYNSVTYEGIYGTSGTFSVY